MNFDQFNKSLKLKFPDIDFYSYEGTTNNPRHTARYRKGEFSCSSGDGENTWELTLFPEEAGTFSGKTLKECYGKYEKTLSYVHLPNNITLAQFEKAIKTRFPLQDWVFKDANNFIDRRHTATYNGGEFSYGIRPEGYTWELSIYPEGLFIGKTLEECHLEYANTYIDC
jgi:hypothetical protein